jgi:hypothetical protein
LLNILKIEINYKVNVDKDNIFTLLMY